MTLRPLSTLGFDEGQITHGPALSAFGAFCAARTPGTWTSYTGAAALASIDAVFTQGHGAGGNILPYINKGAWDPINKKFKVESSQHYDDFRWAKYVEFNDASDTWSVVIDQYNDRNRIPYSDAHGFDHCIVNPYTGKFFLMDAGVENWLMLPDGSTTWSAATPPTPSGGSIIAVGACWWSGIGAQALSGISGSQGAACYLHKDFGVFTAYDPVSNTYPVRFTGINGAADPGPYNNQMEYSVTKNCIVHGGGNGSNQLWRIDKDHTVTRMPAGPHDIGVENGMRMICDPVSGNMLLLGYDELWELNQSGSGTWTKQTGGRAPPAGLPIPSSNFSSSYGGCIFACDTYGVIMHIDWLQDRSPTQARMLVYKHA